MDSRLGLLSLQLFTSFLCDGYFAKKKNIKTAKWTSDHEDWYKGDIIELSYHCSIAKNVKIISNKK